MAIYKSKNATKEEIKEEEKLELETLRAKFIPKAREDNVIMAKALLKDIDLLKKGKHVLINKITTAINLSEIVTKGVFDIEEVLRKSFLY